MTVAADLTRDDILRAIKRLEPQLRAKGVTHLAIFGSRARGDHRPDSDLDVLIDVEATTKRNALYVSFDIARLLGEEFGIEVDATPRDQLAPRAAQRAADDITEVF